MTSEEKREKYLAEENLLNLHKMVVDIYWFTVPSVRDEYLNWEEMNWKMSSYMKQMSNVVAQKLRDMIQQDKRLPMGTKFDDSRVSVPGIFAPKSIFYVTLPGKPWDCTYDTREINIFVNQSCTSNRFGIIPCTIEAGVRKGKKIELYDPKMKWSQCEKIELFSETFDQVMETLVLVASFDSFVDLHDYEVKKVEECRSKSMRGYLPPWEKPSNIRENIGANTRACTTTLSLTKSQKRRLREKRNRNSN